MTYIILKQIEVDARSVDDAMAKYSTDGKTTSVQCREKPEPPKEFPQRIGPSGQNL